MSEQLHSNPETLQADQSSDRGLENPHMLALMAAVALAVSGCTTSFDRNKAIVDHNNLGIALTEAAHDLVKGGYMSSSDGAETLQTVSTTQRYHWDGSHRSSQNGTDVHAKGVKHGSMNFFSGKGKQNGGSRGSSTARSVVYPGQNGCAGGNKFLHHGRVLTGTGQ